MKKAVIAIIIVLIIAAGAGLYFGIFKKSGVSEVKSDISQIEIPQLNLSIGGLDLGALNLDTFDIGVGLPSNLFSNISVDTNLSGGMGAIELSVPKIQVDAPSAPTAIGPSMPSNTPLPSSGTPPVQSVTPSVPSPRGTPPANFEPDEATCNQFEAAPSCSLVPAQYRDLCEKCKNK